MKQKTLNIFLALYFFFINSNFFIYQHYCGNELYATALYKTVTCECGDNSPLNASQWMNVQENDCCSETLLFAHLDMPFISQQWMILIFILSFVFIVISYVKNLFDKNFFVILSRYYKIFKEKCRSCWYIYTRTSLVKSVVLRN